MKYLILLLSLILFASCAEKKKEDCIKQSSDGNRTEFLCPKEVPSEEDLVINYISPTIDAGDSKKIDVLLKNNGEFDVFNIEINSPNNCPKIFKKNTECLIQINLSDTHSGDKIFNLQINDMTKKLNVTKKILYKVRSKLPQKINYNLSKIDENNYIIHFFDNFDEYGNLFSGFLKIASDAHMSLMDDTFSNIKLIDSMIDINPYLLVRNPSDEENFFDIKLQTFYDEESNDESLTVLFNREVPYFNTHSISYNVDEDSEKSLVNLPRSNNFSASYQIVQQPSNGVIKNCLFGNEIFDITKCLYKPKNNFFGMDVFKYKAVSETGLLSDVVTVSMIVDNKDDIISNTSLSKQIYAFKNEEINFILTDPINPDGKDLSYNIISNTINGFLSCVNNMCNYKPSNNYIGNDSFTYSLSDGDTIIYENAVIIIKDKIEKKQIEISEMNININEDTPSDILLPEVGLGNKYVLSEVGNNITVSSCDSNSCLLSPKKDFFGNSYFKVKIVNDYAMESDNSMLINVTIDPINDAPKFLSGSTGKIIVTNEPTSILLDNAFDVEGDSLNIVITKMPTNGILNNCSNIQNGMQCLYSNNTTISDYIEYKAIDIHGAESSVFRYYLSFNNPNTPIFMSYTRTINSENRVINFNLESATDFDANDTLRYRIVTTPSKGVLSDCLNLTESDSLSDLSCTFTPDIEPGTYIFKYKAIDTYGAESLPVTVTLNLTTPQTIFGFDKAEVNLSLNEDEQFDFTYTLPNYPVGSEVTYTYDKTNLQGVLDCVANNCRYIPPLNFSGISYVIIKALLNSNERTQKVFFNIKPINDSPAFLSNVMSVSLYEDIETNIPLIKASDVDTPLTNLSYHLVTQPSHGILSNCLGFLNAGADCTYLPYNNYSGTDTFSYKAFDGVSYSEIVTVNLNIDNINDSPVMDMSKSLFFDVNTEEVTYLKFNKIVEFENEPVSINIISSPSLGTILSCDSSGCNYYGSNLGEDSFIISVSDGLLSSINYEVRLNISPKKEIYMNDLYKSEIGSKNLFSLKFQDMFIINTSQDQIMLIDHFGKKQLVTNGNLISSKSTTLNEFIYFLISRNESYFLLKLSPDGNLREFQVQLTDDNAEIYTWDSKIIVKSGNHIGILNEFYTENHDLSTISWLDKSLNNQINDLILSTSNVNVIGDYSGDLYLIIDGLIYKINQMLNISKISDELFSNNVFMLKDKIFAELLNYNKMKVFNLNDDTEYDELLQGKISKFGIFKMYNKTDNLILLINDQIYRYNETLYKTNIKNSSFSVSGNFLYFIKDNKAYIYKDNLNFQEYIVENVKNIVDVEGELFFILNNNTMIDKDYNIVFNYRSADKQLKDNLFLDSRDSAMTFKLLNNSKNLDFKIDYYNSLPYLRGTPPYSLVSSNNCDISFESNNVVLNNCVNSPSSIIYKDINNNQYFLNIKPKTQLGYFKTDFNITIEDTDYFFKGLRFSRIDDSIYLKGEILANNFIKYKEDLIIFSEMIFDISSLTPSIMDYSIIDAIKNENGIYYIKHDNVFSIVHNGNSTNLPIELSNPQLVSNNGDVYIYSDNYIYKYLSNNSIQALYDFGDNSVKNMKFYENKAFVNLQDEIDGLNYNRVIIIDLANDTFVNYSGYNPTTDSSLEDFIFLELDKFFLIGTFELGAEQTFNIHNGLLKTKIIAGDVNVYNLNNHMVLKVENDLKILNFRYKEQEVDNFLYIPKYSTEVDYQVEARSGLVGNCFDKGEYLECEYSGFSINDEITVSVSSGLEELDEIKFNINNE